MQDTKRHENAGRLSPVSLAFVGDAVFELMVREKLVHSGSMPAAKLHGMSVRRVKATAQALAYEAVLAASSQQEQSILRRGRNVSLSRMPKSCTPQQYHQATAIEALLGYLYLDGQQERLELMFEIIESQIASQEEREDASNSKP